MGLFSYLPTTNPTRLCLCTSDAICSKRLIYYPLILYCMEKSILYSIVVLDRYPWYTSQTIWTRLENAGQEERELFPISKSWRNQGFRVYIWLFLQRCWDLPTRTHPRNRIQRMSEIGNKWQALLTRWNPWMFAYNACHPSHPRSRFSRYKRTVRVCCMLIATTVGSNYLRQSLRCTARAMRSRIFSEELQLILLIGSHDPPWTRMVAHEWWPMIVVEYSIVVE